MYALLLILSLASGVLPRNSPPELGGVPFARFSANGGVVPQETTPSAPSKVASRHFLDGAATPPNLGGELRAPATLRQQALQPWLQSNAAPRLIPQQGPRETRRAARSW